MLLEGKKGLILGVANKRSIAWGIAKAAAREGAQLALTYQNDRLRPTIEKLSRPLEESLIVECDVSRDDHLDEAIDRVGNTFDGLDFVVHAVAFAQKEELEGQYVETSRQGFSSALDISSYSLTAVAQRAATFMEGRDASVLTLSYLGGQRVVPHYNVMGVAKAALEASVRYLASDLGPKGVRVNAISAGPIRTLAASGVTNFPAMLDLFAAKAPLRKNVDIDDVGDAALFFLSRLSRGVTGEILFVDSGFHVLGL